MAPIEPLLEDIKQSLGSRDVRLPNDGEIETQPCVSSSPKAPEVSAAVEQTAESSAETHSAQTSEPKKVSKSFVTRWETHLVPSEAENPSPGHPIAEITDEKIPSAQSQDSTASSHIPLTSSTMQKPRCELPGKVDPELRRTERFWEEPGRIPRVIRKAFQPCQKLLLWPWRRFERKVLRAQYQRKMRARIDHHGRSRSQSVRRCRPLLFGARAWYKPLDYCCCTPKVSFFFWYWLFLPLYALCYLLRIAVVDVLPKVAYYSTCLFCHLWIVNRHRDVLDDEESLVQRRNERMEMLGDLPYEFDDERLVELTSRYYRRKPLWMNDNPI